MDTFIDIIEIFKKFDKHQALENVSFTVPRGIIFGLLGPNGAGKTTLIRIMNRIFEPDNGKVLINNELLKPEHISMIGYLPEERGLYKKMKIGEQLIYLARLKGLTKQTATTEAKFWMSRLEISNWWEKKVEELSKGMQQKVQFIATVLHKPKLLIFDEPFSGFDPINVDQIKQQILWLKEQGTTIIFSTHNMSSVEEICEKIVLINKSKKIIEGNLMDIKNQFSTNTYEISFKKITEKLNNSKFEISDISTSKNPNTYRVNLNENTANELISYATSIGDILSFNEVIPSLHDIFVKLVNENNITINN